MPAPAQVPFGGLFSTPGNPYQQQQHSHPQLPLVQPAAVQQSVAIPSLYDSLESTIPQQQQQFGLSPYGNVPQQPASSVGGTPMSINSTPYTVRSTPSKTPSKSTRVTVFGFPPDQTQKVLSRFLKLGKITRYWFSFSDDSDASEMSENSLGDGNWVHIEFESSYLAQLALTKNGMMMDGYMVGVVPYKPLTELHKSGSMSTTPRMSKMTHALLGSGKSPRIKARSSPYKPVSQHQATPWKELPAEGSATHNTTTNDEFKKPLMKQVSNKSLGGPAASRGSVSGWDDVFSTPIQPIQHTNSAPTPIELAPTQPTRMLPQAPLRQNEGEVQPSNGSVVGTLMERLFGWG